MQYDMTPSPTVPQRFRFCACSRKCGHLALPRAIQSETPTWVAFAYECPQCAERWVSGWDKDFAKHHSRQVFDELIARGLDALNGSQR